GGWTGGVASEARQRFYANPARGGLGRCHARVSVSKCARRRGRFAATLPSRGRERKKAYEYKSRDRSQSSQARMGGRGSWDALRHGHPLLRGGDRAALRGVREERDLRSRELAEGGRERPPVCLNAGRVWRRGRHLRA